MWQCTCVNSRSDVPVWILVIGGVGLVVGLATYGASEWLTAHRVAAELVMGSRLGTWNCHSMPVYCTHSQLIPLGCSHPPPAGYKIMRVLGVKMTKLTNSRGYCGERAALAVLSAVPAVAAGYAVLWAPAQRAATCSTRASRPHFLFGKQ